MERLAKLEFPFYYLLLITLFIIYFPVVQRICYDAAITIKTKDGGRMTTGWMGPIVDLSDGQYAHFRSIFHMLLVMAMFHIGFGRCIPTFLHRKFNLSWFDGRIIFNLLLSICALGIAFGYDSIPFFLVTIGNYLLCKSCGAHMAGPVLTWTYCCFWLYYLSSSEVITWRQFFKFINVRDLLWDSHLGFRRSWRFEYNLVMLRMISFNMDYFWTLRKPSDDSAAQLRRDHEDTCADCLRGELCYWVREKSLPKVDAFHIRSYLAYLFYVPLLAAGPISSFSAFISHMGRVSLL
jgi:D-alanyl-lipoteichoic acid acyltransferase DltB (MBOAT superfamily)